ncbi:Outer membrane protein assembly factor BamB, contains PQQ-like beta-propeller repeat [Tenacibaculum sp. MAR_2009_124]|uniref:outer membrane protein assembly factor BamB family protein n=1 Tax=Tenacibaculum sp. MAR_2009_124 TaxID=1250059 RepID=UPI00089D4DC0|nr:PQQ-binding-like beta-propeller repeat protein [Tenacibaculum sp. MAR_2009_124]SEC50136.1 Outer membrane protein assembly factor BamB, contains PQQ-like beta-propeller repeat [Tenacibaculum sp. MAR_2009_124]
MILRFLLAFFVLINFPILSQNKSIWTFKTNNRVYSSPVIENNRIYIGSGDHYLYAINKNTGNLVWKYKTKGAVHSTPFISNNLICFSSADGNLYGVNKNNGNLVWKFESKGEKMYDLWDYYLSSPTGNTETVYWGCADGNLYAIENKTGKLQWKFKTNGVVHASPVLYKEQVYIGSFDGYVYALGKDNGQLLWKFKTVGDEYFPNGEIQKGLLVKDDVVYFGSRDYNMYAINSKTGTLLWNLKEKSGWIIAIPTEHKGTLYFGTSDAHLFYAVDKKTGIVKWTAPLQMRVYGSGVVHNNTIYFGSFDGKIIGLNCDTGERNYEFQTESSKKNYSLMYNEKGHFKKGFELYGDDFEATEKLIHSLGSILSTPIIENNRIYFGSSDGTIYTVKL